MCIRDSHSSCDKTWCAHVDDPTKKYSSLPYRKPLQDEKLEEEEIPGRVCKCSYFIQYITVQFSLMM